MRTQNRKTVKILAAAAIVAAVDGRLFAADTGSYVTISASGSTAIRNWVISTGFTTLPVGSPDLTLSNGVYSAGAAGLNLAPSSTGGNLLGSTGVGIRFEWHEQGSVEGLLELANDQIGYAGGATGTPIVDTAVPRFPTAGNPIRINRNNDTTGGALGGYTISGSDVYNIYSLTNYDQTTGKNLLDGQNRVQMAFADVVATQGFAKAGTAAYNRTALSAGYGKGNPLLTSTSTSGTGAVGSRQQLVDEDLLNMKATTPNPQDPTGVGNNHNNYGVGSWNSNGAGNMVSTPAVMTATVLAANPGTGLTQLNKGDAQWLQLTGRLQNGVDFNVSERDVNSGTRNTFANNTGVDPSWAVGDNDGGTGLTPASGPGSANDQASIGQYMKFSGKTAGGAQLRPTVENNRMALGPLGLSDARSGSAVSSTTSSFPLRALAYSDTDTDAGASFVVVSTATITDGTYVPWQQETFNTVRNPNATDYNNPNIIKGDPSGDTVKIRNMVTTAITNFPSSLTANPADAAIAQSFILPQMMTVTKAVDGGATTFVGGQTVNGQTRSQWRSDLITFAAGSFSVQSPINQTAGSGSNYGIAPVNGGNSSLGVGVTNIPITAQDASGAADATAGAVGGNYLFGNFNQNGVRDYDAIKKARDAQERLFTAGGSSSAVDATDATISTNTKYGSYSATLMNMNGGTGPSKGDVIVMGDYNGDGKFNGKDLYYMARGAAVSDSGGSGFTNGTLNATNLTFGDKVRSAQLRKNSALDWMNSHATAQQKADASANVTNDASGTNAFKKEDVNRDGLINLADAQLVDHFVGASYKNLGDQLNAVIASNGTVFDGLDIRLNATVEAPVPISLVDVELNDSLNGTIDTTDFSIIRNELTSTKLVDGDTNFDGRVDVIDVYNMALNWNSSADRWSKGDFDLNGVVNSTDLSMLALNWQGSAAVFAQDLTAFGLGSAVPEPTCLGLLPIGLLLIQRRRRAR